MFRVGEFRFLWPYLRAERRAYAIGMVLIVLTSFFLVAVPRLVGEAINALQTGVRIDLVTGLAFAMVGMALLRGLTAFWMRRIVIGASRRIEFRFRNDLFRHIERQDARFFTRVHTGDLISRFTSDVDAVRAAIGPGIMYSMNTAWTLMFAITVMMLVSVPLTIYSLIPLVFLTFVIRFLGPKVHHAAMAAQERLADLSTHAQENFSHIKVLKSYVRERAEIDRMREHSDDYFEQNMRMVQLRAWTQALLWLFGDLVVLFLLILGGWEIIHGDISLGDFTTFKGCQLLLIWPMIALGWVMMLFQRGAASALRLKSLLEEQPEVDDRDAQPDLVVREGALDFDDVTFSYEEQAPVLRDLGFSLRGGDTLGIVGPTGSGKTTLLQLICRLHPAASGKVLVDGKPIEHFPLAALRDSIGYVPQEAFLFSATIAQNIAFGVDDKDQDAIQEVADLVRIHEEITQFPHGYQQRVGERGITLSGGQKQRIALARALLKRPQLLLLDDVLSAVDATTESEILSGLKRWTQDLTTVIVSHRLSAVRHAQQILVLDQGRVIQRGTHDELVAKPGYYADLYQKQALEDELEQL